MQIYQVLKLAEKINCNDNVNKIILSKVLQQDLNWIYANLNTTCQEEKLKNYLTLVEKYVQGFPLAYILGHTFFYNHKIFVDQNVLIPRNETELLVTLTLDYAKQLFLDQQLDVLDLATGSGCIAVSLALEKANWNIVASDVSKAALNTALLNQEFYHLKNINLIESDLFTNLKNYQFDLVISNPPYIDQATKTYDPISLAYEPELALFASDRGFFYYQKIFSSILSYLKRDFLIALEIGFDQKEELTKLLEHHFSGYFYWFKKDYRDYWRFLFICSKKL